MPTLWQHPHNPVIEKRFVGTTRTDADAQPLPVPAAHAREISARLVDRIRAEIERAGGAIGFARFMELALYTPGLGYYSAGSHKLGAGGDFVTAPELGALYGRCVARWMSPLMRQHRLTDVLEIGAGSGALAAAILDELERIDSAPDRYRILEVSADLRERQRESLEASAAAAGRIEWLDAWPRDFAGIVIANEVVDALPFERFEVTADGPVGLGVCWDEGHFRETLLAAGPELVARLAAIEAAVGAPLPAGFRSEYCPSLEAWIASMTASVQRGIVLLADYGLPRRERYHRDKGAGTLRCHYRHRAHADPFALVGLQDITAWVDFTALADAGIDAGLRLEAFVSQAHFLLASGLTGLLHGAGDAADFETRDQAKRLLLPGEMGERFKMMVFSSGLGDVDCNFGSYDMRHRL